MHGVAAGGETESLEPFLDLRYSINMQLRGVLRYTDSNNERFRGLLTATKALGAGGGSVPPYVTPLLGSHILVFKASWPVEAVESNLRWISPSIELDGVLYAMGTR